MFWPPDVPDVGLKKPKELEEMETRDFDSRESMTPLEVHEHIRNIALALAKNYKESKKSTYSGCLDIVSTALTLTGGSLQGKLGNEMIGESACEAEKACRIVFDMPVE